MQGPRQGAAAGIPGVDSPDPNKGDRRRGSAPDYYPAMIREGFYSQPPPAPDQSQPCRVEMSRLISAAVVDHDFCQLLLTSPLTALAKGCNGEWFDLSYEEFLFVLSVEANSLTDFAARWVEQEKNCSPPEENPIPLLLGEFSFHRVHQGKEHHP